MRPGQKCPGNRACKRAINPRVGLGFNEAGAEMPRKPNLMIGVGERNLDASMRPGQKCPGNRRERGRVSKARPLQLQ